MTDQNPPTDPAAEDDLPPADWYEDEDAGVWRWWDGTEWTDDVRPFEEDGADEAASDGDAVPAPVVRERRRRGPGVIIVYGVILLILFGIPGTVDWDEMRAETSDANVFLSQLLGYLGVAFVAGGTWSKIKQVRERAAAADTEADSTQPVDPTDPTPPTTRDDA